MPVRVQKKHMGSIFEKVKIIQFFENQTNILTKLLTFDKDLDKLMQWSILLSNLTQPPMIECCKWSNNAGGRE